MLDADLLNFLRSSVGSTWSLELLLLLRKHGPRAYTQDELVRELRATPSLIEHCLQELRGARLIAPHQNNTWRYAPATKQLDRSCALLARAYEERPVAVVNAILALPNQRLQSFADAFRFKKKDD